MMPMTRGVFITQLVPEITDAEFSNTLQSTNRPVLVELYASDCPYCRQLEPMLQQAAADYAGRVQIVRMDAAANKTRPQYGLSGTPTLVLYVGAAEQVTKTGMMREQQLRAFLDAYV